jgi:hypothetical protein
MKKLELKTQEGTYIFYDGIPGHFAVDCSCGENFGCHYKRDETSDESLIRLNGYKKSSSRTEHTFYMNDAIFSLQLNKNPITIVCNNCEREFPFTIESYRELIKKMR